MNTKSALIVAMAIVIGFSIEPILDRVDFSDPGERLINVVYNEENHDFQFCVKVNQGAWVKKEGMWYSYRGSYLPADAYALQAIIDYMED